MDGNFLAYFGHLNIDVVFNVPELPCRGSVNIKSRREIYGGTAGNFAMVASSLGVPFHIYSAVAKVSHESYLDFLRQRGVDLTHVYLGGDYGPICYSASDGHDQVYYVYQGPMGGPFTSNVAGDDRNYQYVHYGTGPPEDYLAFSDSFSGKKVFDPGQELSYRYSRTQLENFLNMAEICMMNDLEFEKAKSILNVSDDDLIGMVPVFIVTHGKTGSTVHDRGKEIQVGAFIQGKAYDTIGAGDAFRAGFYLGLHESLGIVESVIMGSLVAGIAVQRQIPEFNSSRDEIFKLYRDNASSLLPKGKS
ncbi:MAG: carbohydrate kinase family protein [Candidatus Thermoplasmatota archaeon]|nr:carbohydrate kinase family protein [Candidatus Thermoplasmatota archaeon]